jgi:hypothetical protein
MAEYIGFILGRHTRLVCPMDNPTHRLVLYADEQGRYVLLRDGRPTALLQFEEAASFPARLPGRNELRICIGNIDCSIMTTGLAIWTPDQAETSEVSQEAANVRYSFIIVCTRFARRLQASLASLIHQEGVDPASIEVIVCYVPGADAVDDVLDSCERLAPEMRFVRMAFSPDRMLSKGFMINESVRVARGMWVVLMDADILLAPNTLAQVDALGGDAHFVAPDGRKMLDEDATARVLMGDLRPWEDWQTLVDLACEYRYREAHGVPIGFFQAVRRTCFEKIQYVELNHFEGSDFIFGEDIIKEYGAAVRLEGVPVLHLDHGGSQWYGTVRHR